MQKEKELNEFAWNNKGLQKRQKVCRSCMSVYHKLSFPIYKAKLNKDVFQERQRVKIQRTREFIDQYKATHPCADCGIIDPIVVDIDHIEKGQQYYVYNRLHKLVTNGKSTKRLQEEINNCEQRCANSHRRKTALEQGWFPGTIHCLK